MKPNYRFEREVEIRVDGQPLQGTSNIFVIDGKLDYSSAEEHFYEIIRKWESDCLKKEAEEEEKEFIIDHLTDAQETVLKDAHAKEYHGTDDDMPDAYEDWLMDLDLDSLKTLTKDHD